MRKPVTSDAAVLAGWPQTKKGNKGVTAAIVAAALKLTVFQVTARLKGMQVRGLLERKDDLWYTTGKEAAPEPVRTPSARKYGVGLPAVGLPDDTKVPHVDGSKIAWRPSDRAVKEASIRLHKVKQRMEEYAADKKKHKRELAALSVELDHCTSVIGNSSAKKWSHEYVHTGTGARAVYIAPDGKRYVSAKPFETADLIMDSSKVGASRLKLYEKSIMVRKEEKQQREEEKREDAKSEKKLRGRAKPEEESEVRHAGREDDWQDRSGKKADAGKGKQALSRVKSEGGTLPRQGSREWYAALGREEEGEPGPRKGRTDGKRGAKGKGRSR
jgi:hypothetical protein